MIEESVESFIVQFKPYAAPVEILPRLEGSPLLECVINRQVVQLLERTNPYAAQAGPGQVIINPTANLLEPSTETVKTLKASGLSQIEGTGLVLERERDAVIVDVGVPLVVTMLSDLPTSVAAGDWVRLASIAPMHGFFVPIAKRPQPRREADSDSL